MWPVLRAQGFSKFNGKSAYRYRGPIIDVVNFQSFSSHLAEGLGCTTFSFALNLGVYLDSSIEDRLVRQDKRGRLLPYEYECPFRAHLEKRTPVDGFQRANIFYVDASGRTVAACLQESRTLLQKAAPLWFGLFDDLSRAINYLENVDVDLLLPDCLRIGPGSRGSLETLATLKFLQYRANPTTEHKQAVRDEAEKLFGAYLNIRPTLFSAAEKRAEVARIDAFFSKQDLVSAHRGSSPKAT